MGKLYGSVYQPLLVIPQPNRRDPSKIVAFMGPHLCFFEMGSLIPQIDRQVEVMITRAQFNKFPDGHEREGEIDRTSVKAIMLCVVEPEYHMLVAIDGFERSGAARQTRAHGRETDGTRLLTSSEVYPPRHIGEDHEAWMKRIHGSMWLIPGCGIVVADNSYAKPGDPYIPATPTNVWVDREQVHRNNFTKVNTLGLTRLEDSDWFSYLDTGDRIRPTMSCMSRNTRLMADPEKPIEDYVPGDVISHTPRPDDTKEETSPRHDRKRPGAIMHNIKPATPDDGQSRVDGIDHVDPVTATVETSHPLEKVTLEPEIETRLLSTSSVPDVVVHHTDSVKLDRKPKPKPANTQPLKKPDAFKGMGSLGDVLLTAFDKKRG